MNGSAVVPARAAAIAAKIGGGVNKRSPEAVLNSIRIGMVADKLAACDPVRDKKSFFQLCLSLARGIDYGVANSDVPDHASTLPPIVKQLCCGKKELSVQAAIVVLMISVRNACKMGWFSPEDTEELLTLAKEAGSDFGTLGDLNGEANSFMPIVSGIMSRYYPQLKLGHIIASLEVKPGYGTFAVDFHISKDVPCSPEEKIRLFVASKDNIDTSSCIISPQQVNLLLNGKGVDRRTNVFMDVGPQLPSIVNSLLKYGTNLLQAVGHFDGHYIILIAFMSITPVSSLPAPQAYVQNDTPALSPGSDPEIIEGPSRISLNCPISYQRIKTPVKGHLCKHYQCFDLNNYVEINSNRPSWRCPHCNQSVCFSDIRVDKKMVKVLEEVGENVSDVIISADGSWTAVSSNNLKDESHDKNSDNLEGGLELQHSSVSGHLPDASCNVYDLTKDDEMDILDKCEIVDTKPEIRHNIQRQPIPSNLTPPTTTNGFTQHTPSQPTNALLSRTSVYDYGTASYNMRSEAQNAGLSGALTGHFDISPVLTDAVSPALCRQHDSFQRTNYMGNSTALGQFSASHSLQLHEALHRQAIANTDFGRTHLIPRNVSRTPSAIQALPVQMPMLNSQEHPMAAVSTPAASGSAVAFRASAVSIPAASGSAVPFQAPTVSIPAASGSAVPFQAPAASGSAVPFQAPAVSIPAVSGSAVPFQAPFQSNTRFSSGVGSNIERPRHLPVNMSNMAATSMQNRSVSQVRGLSTPSHNLNRLPQTLSQPPHLMRSSQVPRNHVKQGVSPVGVGNTPSTVQRVQLMSQQAAQVRQSQNMPLQTQSIRVPSSVPLNAGVVPQAVSRTENLIDLQSDQTWRPTGRMRGSLTGQAYSAALSQFMGQSPQPAPVPSARPSVSQAPPLSPVQVLLANRMNAQTSQRQNLPMTHAATVSGTAAGVQPEGPGGVN